ncbi:hypothetical protein C2W62_17990 [Candidatus Entotheonella serta]|nr:hypothetical protein C2W62_17990 [Candidatus Entotheonella serta]
MSEQNGSGWWMFHGDPAHTGFVSGGRINRESVAKLQTLHTLQVGGPVLSTPAIADGYVYVGTANATDSPGANGGNFHKINLQTGQIEATYRWTIPGNEGDTHGFTRYGLHAGGGGWPGLFQRFQWQVVLFERRGPLRDLGDQLARTRFG